MKVFRKMIGALAFVMLLMGSALVVAADNIDAGDDVVDEVNTVDNEIELHGTGTLLAMGSGRVELQGTGRVLIFAEEANVIVSNNAWVRAFGDWSVEDIGSENVKYTGSGALQIRGYRITVDISGNGINLEASGRGSATLKGDWDYWVIRRPRPRPLAVTARPLISRRASGYTNSAVLPIEYTSEVE
jgi:hypothetical protein